MSRIVFTTTCCCLSSCLITLINCLRSWTSGPTARRIDLEHWMSGGFVTLACFCCIGVFHFTFAQHFKKPYFVCHVFVNAIIVFLTFTPSLRALAHLKLAPSNPQIGANSHFYLCWCFALHLYHPVFFRTGMMDWIHHIPVYVLNMLMFGCKFSDVFALQAFIMTGLPGGLDYFLLVLEGEGAIRRATYKSLSAHINNWFRAPLALFQDTAAFWDCCGNRDGTSSYQLFVFLFMGVHGCWNPPFLVGKRSRRISWTSSADMTLLDAARIEKKESRCKVSSNFQDDRALEVT